MIEPRNRVRRQLRRRRIMAFSLLEVLIALILLGGLLALSWSILGTFRDAEMRGWNQSTRLHAIRCSREWMQTDLQHVVAPTASLTTAPIPVVSASTAQFQGDATGFVTRIHTTPNPISLIDDALNADRDREFDVPDLEGTAQVEYRAVPAGISLTPKQSPGAGPESQRTGSEIQSAEPLRMATSVGLAGEQVEELPQELRRTFTENRSPKKSHLNGGSERVLSLDDLYRLTPEEGSAGASQTSESTIPGLKRARFRYSDGRQWHPSWDSNISQSLPRAVEFSFDLEVNKVGSASLSDANSIDRSATMGSGNVSNLSSSREELFEHRVVIVIEPSLRARHPSPHTHEIGDRESSHRLRKGRS